MPFPGTESGFFKGEEIGFGEKTVDKSAALEKPGSIIFDGNSIQEYGSVAGAAAYENPAYLGEAPGTEIEPPSLGKQDRACADKDKRQAECVKEAAAGAWIHSRESQEMLTIPNRGCFCLDFESVMPLNWPVPGGFIGFSFSECIV